MLVCFGKKLVGKKGKLVGDYEKLVGDYENLLLGVVVPNP